MTGRPIGAVPPLTFLSIVVILIFLFSIPPAGAQVQWQADGFVGLHLGQTSYKYDGPGIGSELIFPLDMTIGGVRGEIARRENSQSLWSIQGEIAVGLGEPGNPFTDRDWYDISPGLEVNFSYTESDVTASYLKLDLEGAYLLYSNQTIHLSLIGGVGYTSISQEAEGYVGAVLIEYNDTLLTYQPLTSSRRALTYDISYITPRLGLRPRFDFGPQVTLELSAAGSPIVYIDDRDDHLLRFFTLEADGRGYGFFGGGLLEFRFGRGQRHAGQFLRLSGELTAIGADLSSAIAWYGDDPIDQDDNTGQSAFGIPHEIRSTQYQVALHFGITF